MGLSPSNLRSFGSLLKSLLLLPLFVNVMIIGRIEAASVIHLSLQGNDAWSGMLPVPNAEGTDGPKLTLTGARNAIRALKAKGPLKDAVTVKIAGGRYVLSESVIFTPEDSGTAEFPIVYEAVPGEHPVISGGRLVTGFEPGADGVWQTKIPDVAAGKWYFEQLFVNGQRAVRARHPNIELEPGLDVRTSHARIRENVAKSFHAIAAVAETNVEGAKATHKLTAAPGVLDLLAGANESELKDVLVVVKHNWNSTQRFLQSLDLSTNSLIVSGTKWAPWNPWKIGGLFHFENVKAALDAPGEWFLDRHGTLFYKPLPGQDISSVSMIAPLVDVLIIFQGERGASRYVEHLQFKGISFQHAQWLTPAGGVNPAQAANGVDAAIRADETRHVSILDCEIAHVGGYGLWFRQGCDENRLERCFIHDTGAGGVRIGETRPAAAIKEPTGKTLIDNNIIRHGGHIFPEAVAILVGQSADNTISHNEIADHYYSGVSTGWTWGYTENPAKNNHVEYNHIHHLGQGVMSDLAGFYSLGPSEGTTVIGNIVHDVFSTTYGGWGLYTDEGSTGVTMKDNLVYNTKTGGFHQHFGRDNIISNNIFAFSLQWQVQLSRPEPHRSFTFSNNIVYWTQGALYSGPMEKAHVLLEKNLFWEASGSPVNFKPAGLEWQGKEIDATIAAIARGPMISLQQWQEKGYDTGSVVCDPRFVDPLKYDFRLKDDAAAASIGFVPIDVSKAGVYGDEAWKRKAASP